MLLSIQGMIFIEDPYFNEPAYEGMRGTAEGTASSLKYNAGAPGGTGGAAGQRGRAVPLRSPPGCPPPGCPLRTPSDPRRALLSACLQRSG